ncbi:ribosome biogenesis GTP-binding protein YihA/YsxC [Blattabacterium cuenoti]|uniref:ribosome biogenesis GTP-binding protein YihA/YsxC n=1 Tax=Blattabacterium cuenoti TaxID=1653831 RepID=UPI00163C1589|nr:ribosome biogenesis GTP-binding protein YihA/YsxC [Blattabacterium cuenoti]
MKIFSVKFKKSISDINQFIVNKNYPEYAFAGRSNVGKSSLINCITNRRSIARVSSHPGSTKLINHFIINQEWYLIDLPGYGFSSNKYLKKTNNKLIIDYIFYRKTITCLFLLIDCRILMQKIDINFINFLNKKKIKFCIVFTKVDKLKNMNILDHHIVSYFSKMKKKMIYPKYFKISSKKKLGIKNMKQYIEELNQLQKKAHYS